MLQSNSKTFLVSSEEWSKHDLVQFCVTVGMYI